MSNLIVSDLEFNQELDSQAMAAVNGGSAWSWITGKVKSAGKAIWKKRAEIAVAVFSYFLGSPQRRPY